MIEKRAENSSNYARRLVPFESARQAFGAILRALDIPRGKVLLPAYIGWSPKEGSGVFDPIASLHLDYSFYALDGRLRIDLDSLRAALQVDCVRVLVIIHYFGYVDPSYEEAVKIARHHGVFIVEDEAHAMLTDMVGGICGRLGDACILSFHKMLPLGRGGAAVINDPRSALIEKLVAAPDSNPPLCNFDMKAIANKRKANSLFLDTLLRRLAPQIEPLFGAPRCCEFPQSYPVLIPNGSRNQLYDQMNSAGFGVVSLYHTLISQISQERFPQTAAVSHRILNLPVHQDTAEAALEPMVRRLVGEMERQ
jgi:dTDP-4-amino-4,6-dideoxygalactose transaminase